MTTVIKHGTFCAIAVLASACSADIPAPITPTDTTAVPSVVVVSKVVSVAVSPNRSASLTQAAGEAVSYVSLSPGTAPLGATALIRNRRDLTTATAYMFGGGFDPTPITGMTGDSLEVTVRTVAGQVILQAIAAIPAKRKPTVLRTSPPPRKRDVPLNATITVVFSDPMNPASVNSNTVRVTRGGSAVAGQLLLDSTGTHAEFIPQAALDANTLYSVVLTEGLADVTAETLLPAAFDFTTMATDLSQIAFYACVATEAGGQNCGIHVVGADGTGFAARTIAPGNTEYDSSPAWSPDGRRIAFSSLRHCVALGRQPPPAGDCRREVFLMNADGSGVTKLTDLETSGGFSSSFPAWSPDGTHMVFVAARVGMSALYRINPDGTGLRQLAASTQLSYGRPTWSPDGTRMVYGLANSTIGYHGLHLADSLGAIIAQITTEADGFPAWSPDGTRIAFQRQLTAPAALHHIHLVDPDGQNDVRLTAGFSTPTAYTLTPTWSPDGSQIAFILTSTPREIRVMNSDGSNVRALLTPIWTMASLPAWSPFGSVP